MFVFFKFLALTGFFTENPGQYLLEMDRLSLPRCCVIWHSCVSLCEPAAGSTGSRGAKAGTGMVGRGREGGMTCQRPARTRQDPQWVCNPPVITTGSRP